jgi:hypothetical protein
MLRVCACTRGMRTMRRPVQMHRPPHAAHSASAGTRAPELSSRGTSCSSGSARTGCWPWPRRSVAATYAKYRQPIATHCHSAICRAEAGQQGRTTQRRCGITAGDKARPRHSLARCRLSRRRRSAALRHHRGQCGRPLQAQPGPAAAAPAGRRTDLAVQQAQEDHGHSCQVEEEVLEEGLPLHHHLPGGGAQGVAGARSRTALACLHSAGAPGQPGTGRSSGGRGSALHPQRAGGRRQQAAPRTGPLRRLTSTTQAMTTLLTNRPPPSGSLSASASALSSPCAGGGGGGGCGGCGCGGGVLRRRCSERGWPGGWGPQLQPPHAASACSRRMKPAHAAAACTNRGRRPPGTPPPAA